MCTVTYIPQANDAFILTSNRDESSLRSPQQLTQQTRAGRSLVFPRDPSAGGTWIVVSDSGQMLCLLNGAFEKHIPRPPYRKSRGLIALEFFDCYNADDFFEKYDLEGIEPFTLIIYCENNLYEFRWDGTKKHTMRLDKTKRYIWSSSTLYPAPVRDLRQKWFDEWQSNYETPTSEDILAFHKNTGDGNPHHNLIMALNVVQTVSITQIKKDATHYSMHYYDILRFASLRKQLKLQ